MSHTPNKFDYDLLITELRKKFEEILKIKNSGVLYNAGRKFVSIRFYDDQVCYETADHFIDQVDYVISLNYCELNQPIEYFQNKINERVDFSTKEKAIRIEYEKKELERKERAELERLKKKYELV